MGVWLATPARLESEVAAPPTLEAIMPEDAPRPAQAAIRTDLGAIFILVGDKARPDSPRGYSGTAA
jgi:hypothetical protein